MVLALISAYGPYPTPMQNADCLNRHQALLKPARLPRKLLFPEELGHAGKCDTFPRGKLPRIGDSSLRKLVFPTAFPKATNKIHHDLLSLQLSL